MAASTGPPRTCSCPRLVGKVRGPQAASLPGSASRYTNNGQISSARTHCFHLSGRSPSKPDMLPPAPGPRPGYGDLGSARCHPARRLWSQLVRGKPSRKHHQLRVREGCVGGTAGGLCPEGREHPEGPPTHVFTRSAVGSLGEKKQDVCSGGFTAQNGTPRDWTWLGEVAGRRGARGGDPGQPDSLSKAPVAKPLRGSEASVLVSETYLSPTLLPKDGPHSQVWF